MNNITSLFGRARTIRYQRTVMMKERKHSHKAGWIRNCDGQEDQLENQKQERENRTTAAQWQESLT